MASYPVLDRLDYNGKVHMPGGKPVTIDDPDLVAQLQALKVIGDNPVDLDEAGGVDPAAPVEPSPLPPEPEPEPSPVAAPAVEPAPPAVEPVAPAADTAAVTIAEPVPSQETPPAAAASAKRKAATKS